jgi:hypothetical protein
VLKFRKKENRVVAPVKLSALEGGGIRAVLKFAFKDDQVMEPSKLM